MLRGSAANARILRKKYLGAWGREWPFDDGYLRVLTRESDSVGDVLLRMREDHGFEPAVAVQEGTCATQPGHGLLTGTR
jgi:hypothetical protein